ncbi:MAG: hypothetical protein WD036_01715 [Bauldia sp.]
MTAVSTIGSRCAALALAAWLPMLAGVGATLAEDASGGAVVARIDDEAITENDLAAVAEEFRDQLGPGGTGRRDVLIDLAIDIRLVARAAAVAAIDEEPPIAARMELARNRALYSEYLRRKFIDAVTEAAGRKRFDEELAKFVPGDELRVRHILVKTEDEAKVIIGEL